MAPAAWAECVNIVAPIPGEDTVVIEIGNRAGEEAFYIVNGTFSLNQGRDVHVVELTGGRLPG